MKEGTEVAEAGKIWVCTACGKLSKTRYGFTADNKNCCERGYDESCMLASCLVDVESLNEPYKSRAKELLERCTV